MSYPRGSIASATTACSQHPARDGVGASAHRVAMQCRCRHTQRETTRPQSTTCPDCGATMVIIDVFERAHQVRAPPSHRSGHEQHSLKDTLPIAAHAPAPGHLCLLAKKPPPSATSRHATAHPNASASHRVWRNARAYRRAVHASSPRSRRFNPHRHCPPLTATSFSRGFLPWAFSNTCPCPIINASVGQVSKKPNQLLPFGNQKSTRRIDQWQSSPISIHARTQSAALTVWRQLLCLSNSVVIVVVAVCKLNEYTRLIANGPGIMARRQHHNVTLFKGLL